MPGSTWCGRLPTSCVTPTTRRLSTALSPQSILVNDAGNDSRRIKVFNWQGGYREGTSTSGSRVVTATSHIDRLVEDASTAYMAPEALTDESPGEHLDVFSLGAIAYHIFSGQAPAASGLAASAAYCPGAFRVPGDYSNERHLFIFPTSDNYPINAAQEENKSCKTCRKACRVPAIRSAVVSPVSCRYRASASCRRV